MSSWQLFPNRNIVLTEIRVLSPKKVRIFSNCFTFSCYGSYVYFIPCKMIDYHVRDWSGDWKLIHHSWENKFCTHGFATCAEFVFSLVVYHFPILPPRPRMIGTITGIAKSIIKKKIQFDLHSWKCNWSQLISDQSRHKELKHVL